MSQNYTYPPGFATSVNPSVGLTGSAAPLSATEVGGINPSSNLQALKLDSSGNLLVNVQTTTTTPLPTTDAADGPVTPGTVASKSILIGGQYNSSLPTLTSTQQAAVQLDSSGRPIISPLASTSTVTVVQPTGTNLHTVVDSGTVAATQSGNWSTRTEDGSGNAITSTGSALDVNLKTSSITLTVSGTVTANQGSANATPWNENVAQFGGSAVVTGTGASGSGIPRVTLSNDSSLAANQSVNVNQVGGSSVTLGQKVSASSVPVVIASDQSAVAVSGTLNAPKGRSSANAPVYNVYSSTNITTSAYVQLVASTTSTTNYIDIFDSSGQAMILGVGGSGSEVIQAYIPPGGDQIQLAIPSGSRVAYKALTATANSGYLLMNFYT
jgi:hypothetical protein